MNTTLSCYGKVLHARWRWVVWGILLAMLIATVVLLVRPPVYRSTATLFVRTPGDVTRVQDGGDLFARARADTYAALATGTGVSASVVADLGLDLTPEEFARRIEAERRPSTALLDLAVTAPSEAEAERNLQVVISELESRVRTLEAVPGSRVPRADLVVVDPPRRPARNIAFGLPVLVFLLVVGFAGAILGALAAVIRFALSDSPSAVDALILEDHPGSVGTRPSGMGNDTGGGTPIRSHSHELSNPDTSYRIGAHRLPRRGVSTHSAEGHE